MLKLDTRQKKYVRINTYLLENGKGSSFNLSGIISKNFSNDICYGYTARDCYEKELAEINRDENDVFEYEIVELDLSDSFWLLAADEDIKDRSNTDFIVTINKYLKQLKCPEIAGIYNAKQFICNGATLKREYDKKKKFITYAILKDSIKYIPTETYPDCVLKQSGKLKIFNELYYNSVVKSLNSIGFNIAPYQKDPTLADRGNAIVLNTRISERFEHELREVLSSLKDEIFSRMFDGKLKTIFENNNLSLDEILESMFDSLRAGKHVDLTISTKDIL